MPLNEGADMSGAAARIWADARRGAAPCAAPRPRSSLAAPDAAWAAGPTLGGHATQPQLASQAHCTPHPHAELQQHRAARVCSAPVWREPQEEQEQAPQEQAPQEHAPQEHAPQEQEAQEQVIVWAVMAGLGESMIVSDAAFLESWPSIGAQPAVVVGRMLRLPRRSRLNGRADPTRRGSRRPVPPATGRREPARRSSATRTAGSRTCGATCA